MSSGPTTHGHGGAALVTGACGALGREMVGALLVAGYSHVYAACRRSDEHDWRTVSASSVVPVTLDVTAAVDGDELAQRCRDVRLLVHCAGLNANRSILGDRPDAVVDAATAEVATNYLGVLKVTLALVDVLAANEPATVVNVLSTSGRVPLPAMATYSASKAAAVSLSESLRTELAPRGVRLVSVFPAVFESPMSAAVDIPKPSARSVAQAIVDGLGAGDDRIYPDAMSAGFAAAFAVGDDAVAAQLAAVLAQAQG